MTRALILAAALALPIIAIARSGGSIGRPSSSNAPHRVEPAPRQEFRPEVPRVPGAPRHKKPPQKLV